MRKVAAILMVVVLTMMSLAGCSKSSAVTGAKKADPITITDSTGKTVTLASLPQRSVEKIAELKPDVVFGYASYLDNAEQFKAANIPVICLDCYKVDTYPKYL